MVNSKCLFVNTEERKDVCLTGSQEWSGFEKGLAGCEAAATCTVGACPGNRVLALPHDVLAHNTFGTEARDF